MAFFVQQDYSNQQSQQPASTENLALKVLVIGKKMGLTFQEMNELRLKDLFLMADIYCGEEPPGVREATQEDIDRLFGG